VLDYILSLYLIVGSEHNEDTFPKNYKLLYSVTYNQVFFFRNDYMFQSKETNIWQPLQIPYNKV